MFLTLFDDQQRLVVRTSVLGLEGKVSANERSIEVSPGAFLLPMTRRCLGHPSHSASQFVSIISVIVPAVVENF